MKKIWIYNYEEQVQKMRKLHTTLKRFPDNINDEEFADDLPKFLRSLSEAALENIISTIENNSTSKEDSHYKMSTIHAYKGLEDDNIRIADDIDEKYGVDVNLYYVALTRGMKTIVEDCDNHPPLKLSTTYL